MNKIYDVFKVSAISMMMLIVFIGLNNNVLGQNMLSNPGFENWVNNGSGGPPDNWSLTSGNMTAEQEATTIHGGSYAAKVTWTTTSTEQIEQTGISVTPGNSYTFSFWAYDNDPGGRARVTVRWFDSGGGFISGYYGDYTSDDANWQQLTSGAQVAPSGAVTASAEIRVYDVSSGWTGSATVYVDDAVFETPSNFQIENAYTVSNTQLDVLYNISLSSVNAGDYTLTGSSTITFSGATIDGTNDKLVHLSGASSSIAGDITLDNIADAGNGTNHDFYAGIMPVAYTNTNNPGGTMDNTHTATFHGIVSANDAYNNVWFSDATGAYNGVLIYDNSFDGDVAVGDEILFWSTRTVYNNLSELENPVLVSTISTGNAPYGPTVIDGSDIDETIAADTDPGEKWEGQLVEIQDFTVDSYTDYDYKCSWSDGTNTYYFHVGDNVDYHLNNITLNVGQTYASIVGVIDWYWSGPYYRINPRSQDDISASATAARIVGSFQGWNTTDPAYVMSENANGVYELTKTLSAGDNEYKVLEGDDWSAPNYPGNNQHIILTGDTEITWKVNINDDLVTHTIPVIAGNFISELGGNDWDPSDLTGEMSDPEGDDIFTWEGVVPAGYWEGKVTFNHNWDQSTGGNVGFNSDGVNATTWTYDMSNNTTTVSGPPPPMVTITFVVDDSQSQAFDGFYLKGSWTSEGFYDPGWGGGIEHAAFYDDGTNGDVTPGDHIWTTQYDLVIDGGANNWEWGINNTNHEWLDGNWQFTIPDDTPQTLTHIFPDVPDLVITEIMYNPPESGSDTLEFIEIYNNEMDAVQLNGYYFSEGVEFTFPDYMLNAGEYVVVAESAGAMMNFFGLSTLEWTDGALSNGGEDIILRDNFNRIADSVNYDDNNPWPDEPDGEGPSLVLCDPNLDNEYGENWSFSMDYAGANAAGDSIYASPMSGCVYSPPALVITEIMYNSPQADEDDLEFIEIMNNEGAPLNLEGFKFNQGVSFTFPFLTMAVGEHIVVAKDATAFAEVFGFTPLEWTSGTLSDFGENVVLADPYGFTTDFVPYDSESPWPTEPNGNGPSLTFCEPDYDNSIADYWTASVEIAAIIGSNDTIFATPGEGCGAMVPIADFMGDQTLIEEGQAVNFTDMSLGSPVSWSWSFPGGTPSSSTEQDPQGIVYEDAGMYDVTLTVTNLYGQDTEYKADYIMVVVPGSPPDPDFIANETEIFAGQSVDFFDMTLGQVDTYEWEFEGGNPSTSSMKNPLGIVYNEPGVYDVTLTVTNQYGSDVEVKSGYITVSTPVAYDLVITEIMYNPPETGTDSLEFIEIYNNDIVTVDMEGFYFSEGVTFTFPNMSLEPGEYVLVAINSLAMENTFGVTAYQWTEGALNNGGDMIEIRDSFGTVLDAVDYDDEAPWPTEPDGQGPSLTFCNPNDDNSLGENWTASTEFAAINAVNDTIWASPGEGCGMIAPIANFTSNENVVTVGSTVEFTDLSAGEPTSWNWTFEGGTPGTSGQEDPSVVYNQEGTFDVTLTVTNDYGTDTQTKTDYIMVGYAPEAAFTANQTAIGVGETVSFTDESTHNPVTWSWIFEGGEPNTSSDQNPDVTFNSAGSFDVSLTVTNAFGQSTLIEYNYIQVSVGVDYISIDNLKIYPNPSNGKFFIETGNNTLSMKVYSIVGELVVERNLEEENEVLDLSTSGKGIYFVQFTEVNTGEQTTLKLIVN